MNGTHYRGNISLSQYISYHFHNTLSQSIINYIHPTFNTHVLSKIMFLHVKLLLNKCKFEFSKKVGIQSRHDLFT